METINQTFLLEEGSLFYFKITNEFDYTKCQLWASQKIAVFVGHVEYPDEMLLSGHSTFQEALNAVNTVM